MPYVMSNYVQLYHFLQRQQQGFQLRHHVWVQNIDRINQCTAFAYQTVEVDHCERLNPFICEMGRCCLIREELSFEFCQKK